MSSPMDFERLDVYRVAIQFVALAQELADSLPKGKSSLRNQLERAAIFVPLNIAEGAGEYSRRDKRRFYRIARRSATECAAILHVISVLDLVADSSKIPSTRALLVRIVKMLTRMAQASESNTFTDSGTGTGPKEKS